MKKILSLILVMIVAFQAPIQSKSMHVQSQSMGPKRFFQCLFMPKKVKCSAPELKKARGWLLGASVVTIAAIATALGIALTNQQIKKWKESEIELEKQEVIVKNIRDLIDQHFELSQLSFIAQFINSHIEQLSNQQLKTINFNSFLEFLTQNLFSIGQQAKTILVDIFQKLENRGYPVNKDQYRKLLGHQPRFL